MFAASKATEDGFDTVLRERSKKMQIDNQKKDKADGPERGPKPVTVSVNGGSVQMPKGEASGADIKQAAMAQGISIQEDFSLFKQGKDGLEPVRDNETVRLKKGDEFTAVAPDDVS